MQPDRVLTLTIATPASVSVDRAPIVSLRAEDASGSFGIRIGHADFVTRLATSVVRWTTTDGATRYCALDGGVLRVTRGSEIVIASRDAMLGDSLDALDATVRAARAAQRDAERRARVDETRLHAQTVRRLLAYLRPGHTADGVRAPLKPELLS